MSLTVLDEQPDGSDAGAVLTLYPVVNGQTGQELGCYLFPQTSSGGKGGGAIPLTVKVGDTYLVEVSATTFRAPAGASLVGGNLSLWVTAPN